MFKKVGILATGSELTSGERVDTNSQFIASNLSKKEIIVNQHLTTDDNKINLKSGLKFLLDNNSAVIRTGGLGPTDDDQTRFMISEIINKELIFDQKSLNRIKERLDKKNIEVKENNKRQCLFPEGSIIIPNNNGTASGFIIESNNKIIAALPGPPQENQSMVLENIIPYLINADFIYEQYKLRWEVINFPESNLAAAMEPIAKKYKIEEYIAYRIHKRDEKNKIVKCDLKINLPKDKFSIDTYKNIKDEAEEIIKDNINPTS